MTKLRRLSIAIPWRFTYFSFLLSLTLYLVFAFWLIGNSPMASAMAEDGPAKGGRTTRGRSAANSADSGRSVDVPAAASEQSGSPVDGAACSAFLQYASDAPMASLASLGRTYSLDDLPNLVQEHPSIAMDASQIYAMVLKRYPPRLIRDPSYRVQTLREYPIFADGLKEAGGMRIIGQHDVIDSFVDWVQRRAQGFRGSKMFALVGPAGTGKTQVLNIVDRVIAFLASTEPDFYQYTFEFTNEIQKVPALRALIGRDSEVNAPILRSLSGGNSPIVLLPPSMQARLVDLATPFVRERIDARAIPFLVPSQQTSDVVKAIVAYEMKNRGMEDRSPTEREYYEMVRPYVRIVRRTFDLDQPSVIVRYQGKNPDLGQLLMTENIALSMHFGPDSPLSYYYTGSILRAQGGGLLVDEFHRQDTSIKNVFLEIVQNGTAEYGGAPPLKLNVVPVVADNDESIEQSLEEGAAQALLDRTKKKPMRLLREPQYIMKLIVEMLGPKLFMYRNLLDPETDLKPMDMNVVFPNATESGDLQLPDGHYAIYYKPADHVRPVLVSPRALLLMALTISGTRLETDATQIMERVTELPSVQVASQYFLDPIERLRVLLGKVVVDGAVARDLTSLKKILKEGQSGISSRDAENWKNEVLRFAEASEGPITPLLVDRAFQHMMEDHELEPGKKKYAAWLQLHQRVKAELILPLLTEDVSAVVSGDSSRVDRMYDEIRQELMALDSDPEAHYFMPPDGEQVPINKSRLRKIEEIFRETQQRELGAGLLKNFHAQVTVSERRYQPLLDAISIYLMEKEYDVSMLTGLVDFFKNKPVNEQIRAMGLHAEGNLASHGYDRESFIQTLLFVRDQQAERKRRQQERR